MKKTKKDSKGFTLVELLVVIAIIGLLASLAMVSLQNAKTNSRDARRKEDLSQMNTALNLYLTTTNNKFPCGNPAETSPNCTSENFYCFGSSGLSDLVNQDVMMGLPSDPVDSRTSVATGCYNYRCDGDDYKLRANLENDDNTMQNDGGSSDVWYEVFTEGARNW